MSYAHLFTGAAPAAPAAEDQGPYRLLVVDDEPNVVAALRRVFHREAYELVTCTTPAEALEQLRRQAFHVILTDFMMPGMNGGELLKHARALQPDMLRIMLTGHADVNAVVAAMKTGAVYKFILKPWNDDDLRVTVALALAQHDAARKARAGRRTAAPDAAEERAQLVPYAERARSQLALTLNKHGLLTAAQVQELARQQQQPRAAPAIVQILERGWASEAAIHQLLAAELLLQQVTLDEIAVDPAVAALVPGRLCQRHLMLPLATEGRRLTLAMADPLDAELLKELRFVTGLEVVPVLAPLAQLRRRIGEVYQVGGAGAADFEDGPADPYEGIEIVIEDDDQVETLDQLLAGTDEPPAIRLVNSILLEAIRLGASDIHIQPRAKHVMVRLRIDGVLSDKMQIPHQMHQSIVSRIKVMAELDISERRRPQDGRLAVKTPQRVADLRISTLPTINGEKVVMRILDRNSAVLNLEALGFSALDLQRIQHASDKPQGIVLATGPTGSGKTTTLYSLLHANATPEKNYITIEDPVEYYLDGAGQVVVRDKIGLTFPLVLRAILRQDPDVVLVGEIRDQETAEVAFHAALTGHQVFSTLHTNSAIATISRLFDMGMNPFVVATAIEAIVAQRLVRKVCAGCRAPVQPPAELLAKLGSRFAQGLASASHGAGCMVCHGSGYKGRVGLYEIFLPDSTLRHLIATRAPITEITEYARARGFLTLREDAHAKVEAGLTTAEEVYRVLGPE